MLGIVQLGDAVTEAGALLELGAPDSSREDEGDSSRAFDHEDRWRNLGMPMRLGLGDAP